jgi:hypothetical protein
MTNSDLSTLTKEELEQKISTFGLMAGVILGMQIVALGIGIFFFVKSRSVFPALVPALLLPLLMIPVSMKKKYSAELASRK